MKIILKDREISSVDDKSDLLSQLRIDRGQAREFPVKAVMWIAVAVGVVALLAVLMWWISLPGLIPVRVEMARLSVLDKVADSVLDATGYVTARRQATVSSKVTGKVTQVLVEEGMRVEQNQIVAYLDDSNLRNELLLTESQLNTAKTRVGEARARLREAELTLQRKQELAQRKLISHAELDSAEAAYHSLNAQLKTRQAEVVSAERSVLLQQQRMDDLLIRAPFTGIVVAKNAQPGEMISPVSAGGGFTRTGICSLVDMTSLEIEVDVNEAYINRVKPEQGVQAVLDAYPDWKIPAKVIAIIPTADRQKATVKVRIGFDELDKRILPDMGVKVSFLNSQTDQTVDMEKTGVSVPQSAIRREADDSIIFVVKEKLAKQRVVTLGPVMGARRQVLSGLNPGESYVVEIPEKLQDGSQVVIR